MEIIHACRDDPSDKDYTREDVYFGTTTPTIKDIIDYRNKGTVYNQFVNADTKMACGSYGVIHADNVIELLAGKEEANPRSHWLAFVKAHKTETYDPIVKGSSLQAQMDFATKLGIIGGFYKVKTKDEIMEAMSKGYMGYTGSSNIDREATKKSPDNVCVIKKGSPAHIVCFVGYDQSHVYIRNSGALKHMKLRWEDLRALFSIYIVVSKSEATIFDRIKARQTELKETKDYIKLKGKGLKRVDKTAERRVVDGKIQVNYDGKWYEVI